ncbi:MAG: hypothetical protein P4L59_06700 [Desulfosporosinus sp.]|nr:hypothetical protein [Desulfosporosinus sp.]
MSTIEIEIDFLSDWANILSKALEFQGYCLSEDVDVNKISHKYFNLQKRLITRQERQVFIAKEFSCPPEYLKGLEILQDKIQKGEDLRAHLSARIANLDYDDSLLNDWGIHHLHLGTELDKRGFVKRTGPVLFARFDDLNAFFINVMAHGTWSNQEMLRILYRNWPDSIKKYRLNGISGSENNRTDSEIALLRKGNVLTTIEVEPGVVLYPIGGGYMSSGISFEVIMVSDDYIRRISYLEDYVKSNIEKLADDALKQGYSLGQKLKFTLIIDPKSQALAYEHDSRIAFNIGNLER